MSSAPERCRDGWFESCENIARNEGNLAVKMLLIARDNVAFSPHPSRRIGNKGLEWLFSKSRRRLELGVGCVPVVCGGIGLAFCLGMSPISLHNRYPVLSAILCLALMSHSLHAEDRLLSVKLRSGREFTAHVDKRTDELLWLRFSGGGGSILRPIAWERVVAAELDGETVELNELWAICAELKSGAPVPEPLPAPAAAAPAQPLVVPAVASIRIDAWLANWDADVETDGICVQITPVDENGQVVSVSGTAEIELFAARQRKYHEAPQSGGWMTELAQRWSEVVKPEEIGPSGIVLRLPFAAVHPEFSSGVDNFGLVHVRLTVPGSGVFEQSLDGVRLRNWSPVRNGMYLQNGHRFFSTERTSRN